MAPHSRKKKRKTRKKAGRKSKWLTHVEPFMDMIKYWRRMGLFEKDICVKLDVSEHTFNKYKNEYPQLVQALKESKEALDNDVVNALVQRALGFSYSEDVIVKDEVLTTTKFVPPNTTAQIFYLKNRCPGLWRDVQDHEHKHKHTGKVDSGHSVIINQIFNDTIEHKPKDEKVKLAQNLHAIFGNTGGDRFRPIIDAKASDKDNN